MSLAWQKSSIRYQFDTQQKSAPSSKPSTHTAASPQELRQRKQRSTSKEMSSLRYMFRTAVKQEKLQLYKKHHQMVWETVESGLRNSGVNLLTIWAPKDGGNTLQMYIETKAGHELSNITGPGTDGYVPEWEELMKSFFEAGEWVEMEEVYTLTPTTSTNVTGDALAKLKEEQLGMK